MPEAPSGTTCPHADKGQAPVGSWYTRHGQSRVHTTGTHCHTDLSDTMQASPGKSGTGSRRNPVHTRDDPEIQDTQKQCCHAQHSTPTEREVAGSAHHSETPAPLLYTQCRHRDRGTAHSYHPHTVHALPDSLGNHRLGWGVSRWRRLWGKCGECSDVLRGVQQQQRATNSRQEWWGRAAPAVWGCSQPLAWEKTKSPTTSEMQSELPATYPPCTMALAGVVIIFVNFLSTVC